MMRTHYRAGAVGGLAKLLIILSMAPCRAQDLSSLEGEWNGIAHARDSSMDSRNVSVRIIGGKVTLELNRPSCVAELTFIKLEKPLLRFKDRIISGSNECQAGGTIFLWRKSESVIDFRYTAPKSKVLFWGDLVKNYRKTIEELRGGEYPAPRSPELVIPQLGIKVVDVDFPASKHKPMSSSDSPERFAKIFHRLPRVVAVEEGSSAYYAGVSPGDVIESFGDNSWFLKNSQSLLDEVRRSSRVRTKSMLGFAYHVTDSPYVEIEVVTLLMANSNGSGKWLTDVPTHTLAKREALPGVESANEKARSDYKELWERSFAAAVNRPCQLPAREISDAAAGLKGIANRAGANSARWGIGEGWEDVERELNETAQAACENQRDGGLTKFESVLLAIAIRQIDPCNYSPSADYGSIFRDPRNARYFSKKGYNNTFSRRLDRMSMTSSQQLCLDNLIKASFDVLNR